MTGTNTTVLDRLSFFDDRLNPILVKEVRQALRGKFFRICFVLMLFASVIVSGAMIVDMGLDEVTAREGRDFFFAIFMCLSVAAIGLVPFAAFNAMGTEWDENTFDLLIISNLRPRQIVLGKLLSAITQSLLYFSAFTPFIVFSFLLRGIDLLVVGVLLLTCLLFSLGASMVAIFLSTLSKQKFVRIVLMASLAGILSMAFTGMAAMAEEFSRRPTELRDPDFLRGYIGTFIGFSALVSLCFVSACNLLAHVEENRSSGLRILSTAALLVGMGFAGYMLVQFPERQAVTVVSMMLTMFVLVPAIFFTTEAERLGRRVQLYVPKGLGMSTAAIPFLPGGGRGFLLFSMQMGLITLFLLTGHSMLMSPGEELLDEGAGGALIAILYSYIYIALPSGLLAPFTATTQLRHFVRASIPALALALAFGPSLIGFFVGDRQLMDMEHPGNPFYFMERAFRGPAPWLDGVLVILGVPAALAFCANLPRALRSITEVLHARRARRLRERDELERASSAGSEVVGHADA